MPDLTGLQEYFSAQVAAVLFIIMIFLLVKAFLSQRWGMFASSILMAIVCYVIIANPDKFEALANAVYSKIGSGGLS